MKRRGARWRRMLLGLAELKRERDALAGQLAEARTRARQLVEDGLADIRASDTLVDQLTGQVMALQEEVSAGNKTARQNVAVANALDEEVSRLRLALLQRASGTIQ